MPQYADGTKIRSADEWTRLISAIPRSYTIFNHGTKIRAEATFPNGTDYSGTFNEDDDIVIQQAVDAMPSKGGNIVIHGAKYIPTASVDIDRSSIHIIGENVAGDTYFNMDDDYKGFSNKMATCIVADGIDAFVLGETDLRFGLSLENLLISGKSAETGLSNTDYSSGCGIRAHMVDHLTLRNIEVIRKDKGIHLEPPTFTSKEDVIDIVDAQNLYFAYNVKGLYTRDWVADFRGRNIYGYLNQKNLIDAQPQYNWVLQNILSHADARQATSDYEGAMRISTYRDVVIQNVVLNGWKIDGAGAPYSLMTLSGFHTDTDWQKGALFLLDNIVLLYCETDALTVEGYGVVRINNLFAGFHDFYVEAGAQGTIAGAIIRNESPGDVFVYVDGGYVKSEQSKPHYWFVDPYKISNLLNFNPLGNITNPWNETDDTVGLEGEGATFTASTDYTVHAVDLIINSTGGTGVSITIKDPSGNTVASGLSTLTAQHLPVGFQINFGAFSVAPTVVVSGN